MALHQQYFHQSTAKKITSTAAVGTPAIHPEWPNWQVMLTKNRAVARSKPNLTQKDENLLARESAGDTAVNMLVTVDNTENIMKMA